MRSRQRTRTTCFQCTTGKSAKSRSSHSIMLTVPSLAVCSYESEVPICEAIETVVPLTPSLSCRPRAIMTPMCSIEQVRSPTSGRRDAGLQ